VHFIHQHPKDNDIDLVHCPTEEMIADVLTKVLPPNQHMKLITAGSKKIAQVT
jgi:hypothetical protein